MCPGPDDLPHRDRCLLHRAPVVLSDFPSAEHSDEANLHKRQLCW